MAEGLPEPEEHKVGEPEDLGRALRPENPDQTEPIIEGVFTDVDTEEGYSVKETPIMSAYLDTIIARRLAEDDYDPIDYKPGITFAKINLREKTKEEYEAGARNDENYSHQNEYIYFTVYEDGLVEIRIECPTDEYNIQDGKPDYANYITNFMNKLGISDTDSSDVEKVFMKTVSEEKDGKRKFYLEENHPSYGWDEDGKSLSERENHQDFIIRLRSLPKEQSRTFKFLQSLEDKAAKQAQEEEVPPQPAPERKQTGGGDDDLAGIVKGTQADLEKAGEPEGFVATITRTFHKIGGWKTFVKTMVQGGVAMGAMSLVGAGAGALGPLGIGILGLGLGIYGALNLRKAIKYAEDNHLGFTDFFGKEGKLTAKQRVGAMAGMVPFVVGGILRMIPAVNFLSPLVGYAGLFGVTLAESTQENVARNKVIDAYKQELKKRQYTIEQMRVLGFYDEAKKQIPIEKILKDAQNGENDDIKATALKTAITVAKALANQQGSVLKDSTITLNGKEIKISDLDPTLFTNFDINTTTALLKLIHTESDRYSTDDQKKLLAQTILNEFVKQETADVEKAVKAQKDVHMLAVKQTLYATFIMRFLSSSMTMASGANMFASSFDTMLADNFGSKDQTSSTTTETKTSEVTSSEPTNSATTARIEDHFKLDDSKITTYHTKSGETYYAVDSDGNGQIDFVVGKDLDPLWATSDKGIIEITAHQNGVDPNTLQFQHRPADTSTGLKTVGGTAESTSTTPIPTTNVAGAIVDNNGNFVTAVIRGSDGSTQTMDINQIEQELHVNGQDVFVTGIKVSNGDPIVSVRVADGSVMDVSLLHPQGLSGGTAGGIASGAIGEPATGLKTFGSTGTTEVISGQGVAPFTIQSGDSMNSLIQKIAVQWNETHPNNQIDPVEAERVVLWREAGSGDDRQIMNEYGIGASTRTGEVFDPARSETVVRIFQEQFGADIRSGASAVSTTEAPVEITPAMKASGGASVSFNPLVSSVNLSASTSTTTAASTAVASTTAQQNYILPDWFNKTTGVGGIQAAMLAVGGILDTLLKDDSRAQHEQIADLAKTKLERGKIAAGEKRAESSERADGALAMGNPPASPSQTSPETSEDSNEGNQSGGGPIPAQSHPAPAQPTPAKASAPAEQVQQPAKLAQAETINSQELGIVEPTDSRIFICPADTWQKEQQTMLNRFIYKHEKLGKALSALANAGNYVKRLAEVAVTIGTLGVVRLGENPFKEQYDQEVLDSTVVNDVLSILNTGRISRDKQPGVQVPQMQFELSRRRVLENQVDMAEQLRKQRENFRMTVKSMIAEALEEEYPVGETEKPSRDLNIIGIIKEELGFAEAQKDQGTIADSGKLNTATRVVVNSFRHPEPNVGAIPNDEMVDATMLMFSILNDPNRLTRNADGTLSLNEQGVAELRGLFMEMVKRTDQWDADIAHMIGLADNEMNIKQIGEINRIRQQLNSPIRGIPIEISEALLRKAFEHSGFNFTQEERTLPAHTYLSDIHRHTRSVGSIKGKTGFGKAVAIMLDLHDKFLQKQKFTRPIDDDEAPIAPKVEDSQRAQPPLKPVRPISRVAQTVYKTREGIMQAGGTVLNRLRKRSPQPKVNIPTPAPAETAPVESTESQQGQLYNQANQERYMPKR